MTEIADGLIHGVLLDGQGRGQRARLGGCAGRRSFRHVAVVLNAARIELTLGNMSESERMYTRRGGSIQKHVGGGTPDHAGRHRRVDRRLASRTRWRRRWCCWATLSRFVGETRAPSTPTR